MSLELEAEGIAGLDPAIGLDDEFGHQPAKPIVGIVGSHGIRPSVGKPSLALNRPLGSGAVLTRAVP